VDCDTLGQSTVTKAETTVERVGGYRVVRKLATGGTSDVLLAKAEGPHGFERTVVLKLLLSQFHDDAEFAQMFVREASAYARLSHPSIVQLFDFFAIPPSGENPLAHEGGRGGQLCMVLEHIDGLPLSRLRSMLKAVGRELDDRSAIHVASRIFDALAAAHGAVDEFGAMAPVIHRDVNPSNVLVPWDGHVKLADFGVAKVAGVNHQSVAGMIKGTYGYMAPEQVTGDVVSPRADVYAAGIILWELLARRRAFQRGALPEVEALRAMAEPRLAPLDALRPDLDRTLRDAVKRALEPRADRRTITAEEMVSLLNAIVSIEEGRERLVSAVNAVRHSSQAAMAAVSVAPTAGPSTLPHVESSMVPRAARPREVAPSHPVVKAAPSAGRASPSSIKAVSPAPASPRGLPKPIASPFPTSRTALPAVTPASPTAADPPRRSTASARLAVAIPDASHASQAPSSGTVSLIDALVEAPEPAVHVTQTIPLGPLEHRASSRLALKDAIDDVLRSQPSSMPPSVLQSDRPGFVSVVVRPPATGEAGDAELVEKADAPTISPPPAEDAPPTERMANALITQTLAMEGRPAIPRPDSDSPTGRMPAYVPTAAYPTPPPMQLTRPPAIASPSSDVQSAPLDPEQQTSVAPPPPSGARTAAVALVLLLGLIAGTTSVVAYLRYKKTLQDHRPSSATLSAAEPLEPPAPVASASSGAASMGGLSASAATATPSVIASASPSASTFSSASASPSASTSSSASASPSASTFSSASASPSDATTAAIAQGTGMVRTTGALPGRRIFVDERTLGQTPESVAVKCGQHVVRLGSSGKPQRVDVPCGGEILVGDKF
jgi:serine/threonine-protein kinase